MSSYIGECPTCGGPYKEAESRASHFSSAMWRYDDARGKGAFKKDHPKLHAEHEDLKQKSANLHITHLKHILEKVTPENGASTVSPAVLS
jgi:hypothetical protein